MDREQFQQEHGIVGNSLEIQEIVEVVQQVAPTDITVMISGESGVGKEVIARALHNASKRSKKQLVTVNCGAIPEGLIESELFGHEKGSFTSAVDNRKGYFEIADGGTIFLDEIGDMSTVAQAKVLRVIETGRFMRVGGENMLQANFRLIAATNKDLADMIKTGTFREDLYYRLNVATVQIAPLTKHR